MPYNRHALRITDGSLEPVVCQGMARVHILQQLYSIEFVVLRSCPHDVIIGWDALTALDAFIDCSRREVHFFKFICMIVI